MYMVVWGHFFTDENDTEEDKNEKAADYTMYVCACTSEPATYTMAPFVLGFRTYHTTAPYACQCIKN